MNPDRLDHEVGASVSRRESGFASRAKSPLRVKERVALAFPVHEITHRARKRTRTPGARVHGSHGANAIVWQLWRRAHVSQPRAESHERLPDAASGRSERPCPGRSGTRTWRSRGGAPELQRIALARRSPIRTSSPKNSSSPNSAPLVRSPGSMTFASMSDDRR